MSAGGHELLARAEHFKHVAVSHQDAGFGVLAFVADRCKPSRRTASSAKRRIFRDVLNEKLVNTLRQLFVVAVAVERDDADTRANANAIVAALAPLRDFIGRGHMRRPAVEACRLALIVDARGRLAERAESGARRNGNVRVLHCRQQHARKPCADTGFPFFWAGTKGRVHSGLPFLYIRRRASTSSKLVDVCLPFKIFEIVGWLVRHFLAMSA